MRKYKRGNKVCLPGYNESGVVDGINSWSYCIRLSGGGYRWARENDIEPAGKIRIVQKQPEPEKRQSHWHNEPYK